MENNEAAMTKRIPDRILTALLLAPLTLYELSRMLSAYPTTVRNHVCGMRAQGLLRIAKFEHQRMGAPRARYALSPQGQSVATELIS